MSTIKTNPHRAVDYSESGIKKALAAAGSLEAEVKYDGVRLNLPVFPNGETMWLSRESKELPALNWLSTSNSKVGAYSNPPCSDWRWFLRQAGYEGIGLMIDAEVMVKGVDFNTSSGLIRTKWTKGSNVDFHVDPMAPAKVPFCLDTKHVKVVVYGIIDLPTITSGNEGPIHSLTRLRTEAIVPLLQKHFPEIEWVLAESHTVFDLESLNSLYETKRAAGEEGLVVKDPLCKWKRGKKSGMWKMKPDDSIDGTVCGIVWGTPGKANEGKVIGFEVLLEDGMVVNACGLTDEQKDEFTAAVERRCVSRSELEDFGSEPEDSNPYYGYQVQVSFMERFPDGSLRHPSFSQWRGTEDNPKVKS